MWIRMLELTFKDKNEYVDGKSQNLKSRWIWVVDAHTHIGKEEITTTKGRSVRQNTLHNILDMYLRVENELKNKLPLNSPWQISPRNFWINSNRKPKSPVERSLIFAPLLDCFVTFPFSDINHDKTIPAFQKSNDFVLSRAYSIEYSLRTLPYLRIDPKDNELAKNEIKRAYKIGACGIKLHPISQNFVHKINSPEILDILLLAAKLHLPVIFDVANPHIAGDIVEISTKTYKLLASKTKNSHLMVILGHMGFDYTNKNMAEYLKLPYIYGETSGCRGEDVKLLFQTLSLVFDDNSWSDKLLFGSDCNYFGWTQIIDFWSYLLSNDLLEKKIILDPSEALLIIQKILGENQLKLISYARNKQFYFKQSKNKAIDMSNVSSKSNHYIEFNLEVLYEIYKTLQYIPIRIDKVAINEEYNDDENLLNKTINYPQLTIGWKKYTTQKSLNISIHKDFITILNNGKSCYWVPNKNNSKDMSFFEKFFPTLQEKDVDGE